MTIGRALALYEYKPKKDKELALQRNDVIVVLDQKPSGWWYGRCLRTGQVGVFPSNFVQFQLNIVRALYDYEATKSGRLPLKKNDVLVVFAKPESGWWKGAKPDGTVGVFPKNFIEVIEEEDAEAESALATVDESSASTQKEASGMDERTSDTDTRTAINGKVSKNKSVSSASKSSSTDQRKKATSEDELGKPKLPPPQLKVPDEPVTSTTTSSSSTASSLTAPPEASSSPSKHHHHHHSASASFSPSSGSSAAKSAGRSKRSNSAANASPGSSTKGRSGSSASREKRKQSLTSGADSAVGSSKAPSSISSVISNTGDLRRKSHDLSSQSGLRAVSASPKRATVAVSSADSPATEFVPGTSIVTTTVDNAIVASVRASPKRERVSRRKSSKEINSLAKPRSASKLDAAAIIASDNAASQSAPAVIASGGPQSSSSRADAVAAPSTSTSSSTTNAVSGEGAANETVLCLYDYVAQRSKELSFQKNDVIEVVKKRESGWWEGSLNGRTGRFPRNLTKVVRAKRTPGDDGSDEDSDDDDDGDGEGQRRRGISSAVPSSAGAGKASSKRTAGADNDDDSEESDEAKRVARVNEEAMQAMFARLKSSASTGSSSPSSSSSSSTSSKFRSSEPSIGSKKAGFSSSPPATLSSKQAKLLRRKQERDAALGGAKGSSSRKHMTLGGKVEGAAGASVAAEIREKRRRASLTAEDADTSRRTHSNSMSTALQSSAPTSSSSLTSSLRGTDRHGHRRRQSSVSALRSDSSSQASVDSSSAGSGVNQDTKFEKGDKMLAMYNFDSESRPNTVSLTKGETLTVVRELSDEWILARKADGSEGAVPRQYVRAVVKSIKARALFPFEGTKPRHLSLTAGDVITVIQSQKSWWDGLCGGKFGSFPSNFVRLMTPEEIAKLEAGEDDSEEEETASMDAAKEHGGSGGGGGGSSSAAGTNHSTRLSMSQANASVAALKPRSAVGKPRLFHVKGKELIVVTKTVLSRRSLNDGDVFVLDNGSGHVYVWNGTYARPSERHIGYYFALCLADELSAELQVLEKGHEEAAFWTELGGAGPVLSASEGGDDEEVAKRLLGARKLWRVEADAAAASVPASPESAADKSHLVPLAVDAARMSRSLLQPEAAYVLDAGSEVFVWVGQLASAVERAASLACAERLVADRPPQVSLTFVAHGGEVAFFKQQFFDWQDSRIMARAQAGSVTPSFDLTLYAADASSAAVAALSSSKSGSLEEDPARVFCKKFNVKPSDGIKFGVQKRLFKNTADEIAQFLWVRRETFLNKTVLGEYLSDRGDFHAAVLTAFCSHFCLAGLEFDNALREYLQHYRMPGEAQKIERMMEQFARKFTKENPELTVCEDTCFVLAYATIMLNTDLHNPAIKKQNKMTKEQFVSRNLSLAKDLDSPFLERIYDNILINEIRLDEGFGDEEKSGFLSLRKGTGRFKRKWFVISNNNIYYFDDPKEQNPRFILPLEALEVRAVKVLGAKFAFEVFDSNSTYLKCCKLSPDGVLIEAKFKSIVLSADNSADQQAWMGAIGQNVLANPFYQSLKQRLEERSKSV